MDGTPLVDGAAAEIVGGGFADAIELARGFRFLGDVDGIGRLRLHAVGEFIGGDAGVESRVLFPLGEVALVHAGDEIERFALRFAADALGGVQVQHRTLAAAEDGALINGGQIAGAVGPGAGLHGAIAHDDEGGEVLIVAAESVDGPGAERWPAGELRAAGAQVDGRRVVEGVAVAGTDDGDVIGVVGQVREERGDFEAGLAAAVELPRRAAHERLAEIDAAGDEPLAEGARQRLAVVLAEVRFWVEGIDMADAAMHEEEDDVLGAGGKVGRARRGGAGARFLFEYRGERERAEAFTGAEEEFTARVHGNLSRHGEIRWY